MGRVKRRAVGTPSLTSITFRKKNGEERRQNKTTEGGKEV